MNHRSLQSAISTVFLCGIAALFPASTTASDDYDILRADLVNTVRWHLKDKRSYTGGGPIDERVLEALGRVPRHEFVPEDWKSRAYLNRPLPIGHGQTISQPFVVALMTELLEPGASDRVLEIGTGSGYQAAMLAELVAQVYTIEIVEPLHERSTALLENLGYGNVQTRLGDGYYGWEEHAPFDAIIVTAAASHIPPPLIRQIRPGGVMVIPVGPQFQLQQLTLVKKSMKGRVTTRQLLPVRFVPLTGSH